MGKMQVKINDKWEYVRAYNPLDVNPIITQDERRALPARDLEYFQNKFANHEFRVI